MSTKHLMSRSARVLAKARQEGIALTPAGEPLFARDVPRFREIKAMDLRTDREKDIDRAFAEDDAALKKAADGE